MANLKCNNEGYVLTINGKFAANFSQSGPTNINWVMNEGDYIFNTQYQKISGYKGTTTGGIIVPATIGGLPVLEIGVHGLENHVGAEYATFPYTAVKFPDSVTTIGVSACYGNNVTYVEFGSGLTTVYSDIFGIGDTNGDQQNVTDIVIHDGVTFVDITHEPMGTWGESFRAKYAIEGAGRYHWTGTQWNRQPL